MCLPKVVFTAHPPNWDSTWCAAGSLVWGNIFHSIGISHFNPVRRRMRSDGAVLVSVAAPSFGFGTGAGWLLLHLFVRRGFDIYLQLTLGFIINSTGEWMEEQRQTLIQCGLGKFELRRCRVWWGFGRKAKTELKQQRNKSYLVLGCSAGALNWTTIQRLSD